MQSCVKQYLPVVVVLPEPKEGKAALRVHSRKPRAIRRESGIIQTGSTIIILQVYEAWHQHSNHDIRNTLHCTVNYSVQQGSSI